MIGRLLESGPQHNDFWWIGVLLDAVATLAGTGGKQLLRHAAVSKNPWFYPLGLVCTAMIDPAFDLSAYGFAAQSIIAPCAGMVVVWNVLLAPCTLNERLTRSRLTGALLICVGTVCVGLYGSHDDVERSVEEYLALFARPAAVASMWEEGARPGGFGRSALHTASRSAPPAFGRPQTSAGLVHAGAVAGRPWTPPYSPPPSL